MWMASELYHHQTKKEAGGDARGLVLLTYENMFCVPNRDMYIPRGKVNLILHKYQAMGFDRGSVVHDTML